MIILLLLSLYTYLVQAVDISISCINNKHISLTFDDGPHENTINLVNILDSYNIKGTFFINMIHVTRNEVNKNLVKYMYDNGHIIGSHLFSHGAMEKLNEFNQKRELFDNELLFRSLLNIRPYFYRPPYFSYNDEIINLVNNFGYNIVVSNLNTDDWKASNESEILDKYTSQLVQNNFGYITIQHDYQTLNNAVLAQMIEIGLQLNYSFVPLDECLNTDKRYYNDNTYGPNLLDGI